MLCCRCCPKQIRRPHLQATPRWPAHTSRLQLPTTSRQACTVASVFDMTALGLHDLLSVASISVSLVQLAAHSKFPAGSSFGVCCSAMIAAGTTTLHDAASVSASSCVQQPEATVSCMMQLLQAGLLEDEGASCWLPSRCRCPMDERHRLLACAIVWHSLSALSLNLLSSVAACFKQAAMLSVLVGGQSDLASL